MKHVVNHLNKFYLMKLVDSGNNHWSGIDVNKGEVIDYKESGIIDPTKVTRLALENAASVAGTVLLTECTVVNDLEDKDSKQQPSMDPSMMGMM